MKKNSAVYCEALHFSYGQDSHAILRGVDLEIERGEFVVIAGPSGEGKSTFCRTLNNIIPFYYRGPFSGRRWIAGEWLERQSIAHMAQRVGMVFQDFEQQLFSTSALLELAFGLENFAAPHPEMQQRVRQLTERFDLTHLIDREPFSLSGGEKQKLAIASVVAYGPQILVLDEPTTDLDPESREFVFQILPRLKEWVETVIVIDHESDQFQTADRIFLFREGAIQSSGKTEEMLTRSELLEANSLSALDLVKVQQALRQSPRLTTPAGLAESLRGFRLQRIEPPQRTQSRPVVEVENLSFRYAGQTLPALHQISFQIREGEFVGIIGRNGSGKSTLLHHLNGLQLPQQGTVKILRREVREWNRKELARTVGLVFQNPDHQIFSSSVREEVEFGPRQFDFPAERMKENTDQALQTMDLIAQMDRDPFQLSKGERQRVAVASILSVKPEILILDEPTTGLDFRQQTYLMKLLSELNRAGTTIIIVTHSLKLVADYCNYAILLAGGKKVAEGHPRELFFEDSSIVKRTPILELSRLMNGNALCVDEFVSHLVKS